MAQSTRHRAGNDRVREPAGLADSPTETSGPPPAHYEMVVSAFAEGRVIPFLGAGANLINRREKGTWSPGRQYLPAGRELAAHLAKRYRYSGEDAEDLLRVSQYVAVVSGLGPLYEDLRRIFAAEYPPSALHTFLASLPANLRAKGYRPPPPLLVTTNYDDALEQALRQANEPFDVLSYIAKGKNRGKFWHVPHEGSPVIVDVPNEYRGLSPGTRTTVVKIHGAIDRSDETRDSYVITEDHYIDYLTHTELASFLPATIAAKMLTSHFLFLGYSLQDWNLRVILHRIWAHQELDYKSWAVQLHPSEFDHKYWGEHNVDVLDVALDTYVQGLQTVLAVPDAPPADD